MKIYNFKIFEIIFYCKFFIKIFDTKKIELFLSIDSKKI